MKDIEWLKEEIKVFQEGENMFTAEFNAGVQDALEYVQELIDQLDEPEVKQLDEKIKELDSYNDELIKDNNQLRNELDNQKVLSQEWIDDNKVARINNLRKMTTSDVVPVEKLKNLIAPKQDKQEVQENFYTFDNAKKWLQDNGFVVFEKDKLDEEVQRMVDETYEATNEKPVIPQFVADYIEQLKKDNDSINQVFAFMDDKEDKDLWHWLFPSMYEEKRANQEVFMRAWLDGYEVEKEKEYRVVFNKKPDDLILFQTTGKHFLIGDESANDGYWKQHFTEAEIKAIDERYWAFAEEVQE